MRMVLALAALVAAACFAGIASAQTGSLVGEELQPSGSVDISQFDCSPAGATVVFTETDGSATGPYPGTYSETITLTTGPLTQGAPLWQGGELYHGTLASAKATFTIVSGGTTITGTKTLAANDVSFYCTNIPSAECTDVSFGAGDQLYAPTMHYEARIRSTTSSGDASVLVGGGGTMCGDTTVQQAGDFAGGYLDEVFLSSNAPAQVPTTLGLNAPTTIELGTFATGTVTVLDQNGEPVADATVYYSVRGVTEASNLCVTDSAGQCTIGVSGGEFPGTATLTAYVDVNGNGVFDAGEPTATQTITITPPPSTAGQTTGGGRIANRSVTFTVAARGATATTTPHGECTLVDQTLNVNVKCVDVIAYVQVGNTVRIYGHATVNGVPAVYRLFVADGGTGTDTVKFVTTAGYGVSGAVVDGNLVVH